jgi:hypothetical protein
MMKPLCIGIKRGTFRANDSHAVVADTVFQGNREAALRQAAYRCIRCSYESTDDTIRKRKSSLHVHHMDNDHHNNEKENLGAHCSLDHAYHHIGCNAPTTGGAKGWSSQMRIAYVPELSAEDINLLQRALGAAIRDKKESDIAAEVLDLLGVLTLPVRDVLTSNHANDFAACFANMTAADYDNRATYAAGLRVLFHPEILKQVGQEMLDDAPLFPVKSWAA